jgi:hypothetical protein
MCHEASERRALGDPRRQHVQVLTGRHQDVAVEISEAATHLVDPCRVVDDVGASALLGHTLASEAREVLERACNARDANPAPVHISLKRLDRAKPVGFYDCGTHVGDDVLGCRYERVIQKGYHALQSAPRYERERDIGTRCKRTIESEALGLLAGEERAVEVCGE